MIKMCERKIVWDENKNISNKAKHKVGFDVAQYVFADQNRIERCDNSAGNNTGEERWQTIGKVGKLFFVVYTERGDETRIISARAAVKPERRSYNGGYLFDNQGWGKTT